MHAIIEKGLIILVNETLQDVRFRGSTVYLGHSLVESFRKLIITIVIHTNKRLKIMIVKNSIYSAQYKLAQHKESIQEI